MVNIKIDLNVSYVYIRLNDGLCVKEKNYGVRKSCKLLYIL